MRTLAVIGFLSTSLVLAACVAEPDDEVVDDVGSESLASGMDMGGDHCPGPAPIMQVGDFNGDGTVNWPDLVMYLKHRKNHGYAAFFDLNADGKLNWIDTVTLFSRWGNLGTVRDAQMADLWRTIEPYLDVNNALAAGYVPFTPELAGHGIHFANFTHIYSWAQRGGFQSNVPEGLNYSADGKLLAAFFYAPGAVDLNEIDPSYPPDIYYKELPVPPNFDGLMPHVWHNHTGACFGGATSPVPGFDQCMTQDACSAVGGQLWSDKFLMLHVWMIEFSQCGPFAGIDPDVAPDAPEEPNHMACTLADVVPVVVP